MLQGVQSHVPQGYGPRLHQRGMATLPPLPSTGHQLHRTNPAPAAERRVCFPGQDEEWRIASAPNSSSTAGHLHVTTRGISSPTTGRNGGNGMGLGESLGRPDWGRGGGVSSSPAQGAAPSAGAGAAGTLGSGSCVGGWSTGVQGPQCAGFRVGIYGWRKRCLYLLVLSLMVMVIVNLALTLWLLKVMEFSSGGMGNLKIVAGGIQLSGKAMFLDSLVASSIKSRRNQNITIESSRNFSVNARDDEGRVVNRLFLGDDRLEVLAKKFRVVDPRGTVLFSADQSEVMMGADVLRVTGAGGAVFDGTVQTPIVRADSGNDLRLESPTRSLEVRAPLGVAIESRAGDISASCLTDLKLQSIAGAIRLDSSSVMLPMLKLVDIPPLPARRKTIASDADHLNHRRGFEVFQLCVCGNGKLFVAPSVGDCVADSEVCR